VGAGFSTVTPPPSQVSATSVAQAVWSYSPRSLTEIQNLTVAIQNNDPNILTAISDLQYVPVPYYAGQASLTQVAAFIDNAIRNYGLVNPIANFIANNPYNLWTTNFVASLAANPYLTATSLNMLLSNFNMTANSAQFLLYYLAQNYYYNKWIQTVTASAPSITFSANATLSTNVLIAQSITIASGVTVTCGTITCFFIAQSFNNYGTITAIGAPGGVTATSSETNYGGTGGGGIVAIAITAVLGTLNVSGGIGGTSTNNVLTNSGGGGVGGMFYIVGGVTVPIGGTGGASGYLGAAGINGGGGGGNAVGTNGGKGGNATAYSFSSPNAMVTYILQGLSDWWLINVLGKSPSSTTPLAYMNGSGGGAGSGGNGGNVPGGGGGGGGEVVVYGYDIISGTINAAGGIGGNAYSAGSAYPAGGGGGGGGGLVFIFYGATSGGVTANVAGGTGGVGTTSPTNGLAGANGTAYIAKVTVNG